LPIVALMTFDESAETLAGVKAAEAGARLAELDVSAVGANHGAGLLAALAALEEMHAHGRALAALPNIGLASLSGGRVIYPHATPEYFAEFAAHARDLGARVIGGCCGTTPTEIAAIREALEEERRPRAPLVFDRPELFVSLGEEQRETGLERAFREGEWVVTVQLDPPLGGNNSGLLEIARGLAESGRAGFVDVNDNATARVGINSLMSAVAIERVAGIETIPHLTPRDMTLMGLQSALLGAHAEGVRNILAVTGDPPEVGDYAGSQGVYQVDSIGLTELITRLNRGEDYNGRAIDAPTSFYVGVAVNPTADDLELELDRFHRKVEAGARFAITQIVFDLEFFDGFTERLGGSWPIPVLLEVFPLTSYRLALRLHNEVPGIVVPDALQAALEQAGPDAAALGFEHARGLIAGARERAAGICAVAPFRQPLRVLELL
jgi:methionine synthase / methylenetetrahydrofolate reductase(NADPH)